MESKVAHGAESVPSKRAQEAQVYAEEVEGGPEGRRFAREVGDGVGGGDCVEKWKVVREAGAVPEIVVDGAGAKPFARRGIVAGSRCGADVERGSAPVVG